MRRTVRAATFALLFAGVTAGADRAADAQSLALVGGTVYGSPNAAPLQDAVVVTSGGVITAIGKRGDLTVPPDAVVLDCTGKTVVAGFWNSHVHFTAPAWNAGAPAAALEQQMQQMLTRWGVTTVWDLGSDPFNSLALRRRVDDGDVRGPRMFLTGTIYPKDGHPIYIPAELKLPEVATADQAGQMARNELALGLDGMKLFTGAFMGDKPVINMPTAVAKAAVDVAHAQGKPAFAHPQNHIGVDNAVTAGVDILAHTVVGVGVGDFTAKQLALFKSRGTALVPTLSLWTTVVQDPGVASFLVGTGVTQLKSFSDNGGVVLFGTDVGFTAVYDTSLEFELMHRALSSSQILAALTTNPAAYFKAARKGRVDVGFDADFAVLDGDPIADARNFAKVAYTIRAGRVIYP